MEDFCLANQWKNKLELKGWSQEAILFHRFSLADSTMHQYHKVIVQFLEFCQTRGHVFINGLPIDSSAIANFVTFLGMQSDRPKSKVTVAMAALSNLYQITENEHIVRNQDISRLITGITKAGTKKARRPTPAMPIQPFRDLFLRWEDNQLLDIQRLRLKCITLLALVLMLRASDIAPKGLYINSVDIIEKHVFSLQDISFLDDGSMTIMIHGNKNDYDRDGFQVTVPAASDPQIDPVATLKCYIARTAHLRPPDTNPVFLSLRKQQGVYAALSASGIQNVLNEAIIAAGLGGRGYCSKSFRVTGATTGVVMGQDPNVVRNMGRWKSCSIFEEHYVHTIPPNNFTDSILHA